MATTIFLVNPQTFSGSPFTNEKSLLFDGVDEYLSCGVVSELVSATSFSISFWVKFNSSTNGFCFGHYSSGDNGVYLRSDVSTNLWRMVVGNGGASYHDYSYTINTGQWYHVVMTYDGGQSGSNKMKFYIDGSVKTT